MRKQFFYFIIIHFSILSSCLGQIENSTIPLIEKYEIPENLPEQKFSKNQYSEIKQALAKKEEKIRIASYNVLFNVYDDNLDPVNRWPSRLPRILELIEEMQPDILAVQELYPDQQMDLEPSLSQNYAFFSGLCSDGESSGIFFRKNRFHPIEAKALMMTDVPNGKSYQTLAILVLLDKKTGRQLALFNTHLSFSKADNRESQACFIVDKIEPYAKKMPVVLAGDLNTFPARLELETLPFYDGDYIHRILSKKTLKSAKEMSLLGHFGPNSTFTNHPDNKIPFTGTGTPGVVLDHIYISKGITVLAHAVQPAKVNGHFPSDHMPILIDMLIE